MTSYGSAVHKARLEKRLTLEEVADRCWTHKGYISGIENGKVSPPSQRLTRRLARVLGLHTGRMLAAGWWEKRPKGLGLTTTINYLLNVAEEA